MPVYVTFHEIMQPVDLRGSTIPLLGPVIGNRSLLTVSGTDANSSAAPKRCLAVIRATEAAAFAIGVADAVTATTSEVLLAGEKEIREVAQGQIISVVAPA